MLQEVTLTCTLRRADGDRLSIRAPVQLQSTAALIPSHLRGQLHPLMTEEGLKQARAPQVISLETERRDRLCF